MIKAHLYTDYATDPFFNMGADEALLQQAMATHEIVYLRLYTWSPGGITFGYHQNAEKVVDYSLLGDTPLIRRITGGRALYHDPSELTYAIAYNREGIGSHALAESVSNSSRLIGQALSLFVSQIGRKSSLVKKSIGADSVKSSFFHTNPCFASSARYELLSEGIKIAASAQKRVGEAVLQHGSIKIFGLAKHPALDLSDSVDGLQPIALEGFKEYVGLLARAFEEVLGLECVDCDRTEVENQLLEGSIEQVKKNSLGQRQMIKQTDR